MPRIHRSHLCSLYTEYCIGTRFSRVSIISPVFIFSDQKRVHQLLRGTLLIPAAIKLIAVTVPLDKWGNAGFHSYFFIAVFLCLASIKEYIPDIYSNKLAEMINAIIVCCSAVKSVHVRCTSSSFFRR